MTRKNRIAGRWPLLSLMALGVAMPAMAQTPAAPAAGPQTSPQSADTKRTDRDVVVITANKREESIQDAPVAVTAITSEKKDQFGIITVTDLTNVTPGLSYTPGNERVTLRGVGRLTNSFGADPGVANYNDGIYTAFAVFAGKDPILIDRVEVLRGPQGTLYGRNAIGGAINTISKRPTSSFRSDFEIGVGNFGEEKIGASVSGPITDWLRYRVVGFQEKRDGIDFDYGANADTGWEINDKYYEAQLEGNIGDRFNWWFKVADTTYKKAGPPGGRTASFSTAPILNSFSTGGITPNAGYAYGNNASLVSYTGGGPRKDNPFATNGEHAYNNNREAVAYVPAYDEAILEMKYDLGFAELKYIGGYTYYDYRLVNGDPDGTSVDSITYRAITSVAPIAACAGTAAALGYPLNDNPLPAAAQGCITGSANRTIYPDTLQIYRESRAFFSNELNLISTGDGPLQYIFGLYAYQDNDKQPGQVQYLPNEPLVSSYVDTVLGVIQNPERKIQIFSNDGLYNAYGVYGQGDWTLNDQWKFTLGLRYSKDLKKSEETAFLDCFIICGVDSLNYTRIAYGGNNSDGTPLAAYFDNRGVAHRFLNASYEATTGTLGAEWRPMNDSLLFAKYSRGYKAGAFNNLGFGGNTYSNPEFVDSYEGGWKQTFAALNLTTDTSVFYYNYTDLQSPLTVINGPQGQTGSTSFTAFVNVPKVQTKGFELEGNWNPIDPLNIGFTYAYLDTEITSDQVYLDTSKDPRCINTGANAATVPYVTCSATSTVLRDPSRIRSLKGNQLSQSPKNKVALNASYRFEMADGSYYLPTISYSWRDKFYDSFFNNAEELSPSYYNLDARLNWFSSDGKFEVTVWGRNITDEDQNTSISVGSYRIQDNAVYQGKNYSLPRTFGVDFRFHWK